MQLREMVIHRAPGLQRGLVVPELRGMHVLLVGPNASGKSTIGRVIRGTLWPEHAQPGVVADTRWSLGPDHQTTSASLVFGQIQWEGAALRPPMEAAAAWHLSVADLLRVDQETEGPIAREIEKALAGGFDLCAARAGFHPPGRPPTKLIKGISQATEAVRHARAAAGELTGRERDRAELETQRQRSERASGELRLAEKAVEHARAQGELAAVRRSLELSPEVLADLRGEELDEVEEYERAIALVCSKLHKLEGSRVQAQGVIRDTGFSVDEPSPATVSAQAARARDLREIERELRQVVGARQAALGKMTAAAQELFVEVPADLRIGRAKLQRLEAALECVAAAKGRAASAEQLVADNPSPAQAVDLGGLEGGVHALRGWLAMAPNGSVPPRRLPGWLAPVALVVGVILAAVGVFLQLVWSQLLGAGALGAGLALLAQGVSRRESRSPEADPRATYRAEYERSGLPAPEAWEVAAVQRCLHGIEAQLDLARGVARATEAHERAKAHADAVVRALHEAQRGLEQVLDELSLEHELGGLSVLRLAQRLESLSVARDEAAAQGAKHRALAAHQWAMLHTLGTWLEALGCEAVIDGDGAEAAVAALRDRLRRLESARDALAADLDEEKETRGQLQEMERKLSALYRRAGLGDGQKLELGKLLDELPAFRALQQRQRDLLGVTRALAVDLDGHQGWLDLDLEDALQRVAQVEALAAQLAERTSAVEALDADLRRAKRGRTLEQARAQQQEALAALGVAKQAAVEESVGVALVDWVQRAMARDHQPRMLERAQQWFLRFTRGAFQLDVVGDAFVARDVRFDQERKLSQLSDATRVQLLLAARLAFLEDAEGDGPKLPLFLDEALSTTDRDRFREIVRCLLELVREGRQVFYATADRAEVDLWRAVCAQEGVEEPQVVDLAAPEVKGRWEEGVAIAPEAQPHVPDPRGQQAATYLASLGVSTPVLHDVADSWHLGLLLQDDLSSLAACLREGVASVGVWRALRVRDGVPLPVSPQVAARVDARAAVLAATLAQLRIGRGRPVTWDAVHASGAVTAAFESDMKALLLTHGHDPEAYVKEVGSLPRYRTGNKSKLHDQFVEEGLLDEREALSMDDICVHVLDDLASSIQAGALTIGEAERMVKWIAGVVG